MLNLSIAFMAPLALWVGGYYGGYASSASLWTYLVLVVPAF